MAKTLDRNGRSHHAAGAPSSIGGQFAATRSDRHATGTLTPAADREAQERLERLRATEIRTAQDTLAYLDDFFQHATHQAETGDARPLSDHYAELRPTGNTVLLDTLIERVDRTLVQVHKASADGNPDLADKLARTHLRQVLNTFKVPTRSGPVLPAIMAYYEASRPD